MNKRWFAAFLILCLPVLLAQSSARTTGHKVLPVPSCTEDWVQFLQTGAGLGETVGSTIAEPLLVIEANVAESGTLTECFEWGTAGTLHIKYVCSSRYFRIAAYVNMGIDNSSRTYGVALGTRGDSTKMTASDFIDGTVQNHWLATSSINMRANMWHDDLSVSDGDYFTILGLDLTGGTSVLTTSPGTKLVFTSMTCTRGTPS